LASYRKYQFLLHGVVLLRWQEFGWWQCFFDMPLRFQWQWQILSMSRLGLSVRNRWMSHYFGCPGMR